jgi:hypothetical protein
MAAGPADGLDAVSQQDSDRGFVHSCLRTPTWKLYPSTLFDRHTLRGESFTRRAVVKMGVLARPFRLLDLEHDPLEMQDVGGANRDLRRALRAELEATLASRPHLTAPPVTVDEATEAKLKALGYVE